MLSLKKVTDANRSSTLRIYSFTLASTISITSTVTMNRSSEEIVDTSVLYHSEHKRVKTFASWPVKFISHKDMAAAGFYYIYPPGHKYDICDCHLSYNDTVRCAFCGIMLEKWEKGDDPITEHQKWAPLCPFIRDKTVKKPLQIISDDVFV